MVEECVSFLGCDVVAIHESGDHTLFVGEVKGTRSVTCAPILFYESHYPTLDGVEQL